jgi:hypothetical protein
MLLTWDDRPVVEHLQTERLALRGRTQVRLEPVGVDDRDQGLDSVQWRARLREILGDVSTAPGENCVDGRNTVCWCLYLDCIDGLHQPRRGLGQQSADGLSEEDANTDHEKRRVADAASSRDDLSAAPEYRFLRKAGIQDAELDISHSCRLF